MLPENRVVDNQGFTEMMFEKTEFIKIFRQKHLIKQTIPKMYLHLHNHLDLGCINFRHSLLKNLRNIQVADWIPGVEFVF